MSTTYTIIVENQSPYPQNFFFFQKPASYTGGAQVYSNSIGSGRLPASGPGTAQLQFQANVQYYAGVGKQVSPPKVGNTSVGDIVQMPIDITPSSGTVNNMTQMQLEPLNLTAPTSVPGVQEGAFRIKIPAFNPNTQQYDAGLSTTTMLNGGIPEVVLSNFVTAEPQDNLDVQPVVKFYVSTGNYTAGTVVNFTESAQNSAICDATSGKTDFLVTYTAKGGWTVK